MISLEHIKRYIGISIVLILALGCLLYWSLSDLSIYDMDVPGAHWLGTDVLGRDLAIRLAAGFIVSLCISIVCVCLGAMLGITIGILSGSSSILKNVSGFLCDLIFGIPVIVLVGIFHVLDNSLFSLITGISLQMSAIFWRISYFAALKEWSKDYVISSLIMQKSRIYVVKTHIIPNIYNTLKTQIVLMTTTALSIETSLSYLGIGVPTYMPSIGSLMEQGQVVFYMYPHHIFAPMLLLVIYILGLILHVVWHNKCTDNNTATQVSIM